MSDPRKLLKQKDPIEGIDITAEHEKILAGQSRLSKRKRDQVLAHVDLTRQIKLTEDRLDDFLQEQKTLAIMRKEYAEMVK